MEDKGTGSSKMSINSYCATKHHIPQGGGDDDDDGGGGDNSNCSMLTVSELSSNKHSPSCYSHYLIVTLTFVCLTVVTKINACREGYVCAA